MEVKCPYTQQKTLPHTSKEKKNKYIQEHQEQVNKDRTNGLVETLLVLILENVLSFKTHCKDFDSPYKS